VAEGGFTQVRPLPRFEIHWYWLLRAKRAANVDIHIRRLAKRTGIGVVDVVCGPSPTRPGLFDVRFTSPLGDSEIRDAIFTTLCYCRDTGLPWSFHGPYPYTNGKWEFSGESMNIAEGYEWISFTLRNWISEDFDTGFDGPTAAAAG